MLPPPPALAASGGVGWFSMRLHAGGAQARPGQVEGQGWQCIHMIEQGGLSGKEGRMPMLAAFARSRTVPRAQAAHGPRPTRIHHAGSQAGNLIEARLSP